MQEGAGGPLLAPPGLTLFYRSQLALSTGANMLVKHPHRFDEARTQARSHSGQPTGNTSAVRPPPGLTGSVWYSRL